MRIVGLGSGCTVLVFDSYLSFCDIQFVISASQIKEIKSQVYKRLKKEETKVFSSPKQMKVREIYGPSIKACHFHGLIYKFDFSVLKKTTLIHNICFIYSVAL